MTTGFCLISSGVPLAMTLAVVEHADALADAHDQVHIVLDEQDGDLELVADLADVVHQLGAFPSGFMPAAGSSSRRMPGLGRQRAHDFQPALRAVGQAPGRLFRHDRLMPKRSKSSLARASVRALRLAR